MLRHAIQLVCRQKQGFLAWRGSVSADAGLLGKSATAAAPFTAASAISVDSFNVRQQLPASIHSITSKVHRRSDEGNERLLQEHAAVFKFLQKLGVSLSAMMAILRYSERRQINLTTAQGRIKQLQEHFGESMVNDMLALAPALLTRNTDRLLEYYKGLTHVLGSEKLTKVVIKKMPDLLQHKPEMVQARIQALQELLQVDRASILSLARKGPTLLRMSPKKIQPHLDFLFEVAGLTPAQAYKVFHSWPVLASTTNKLVKERYKAITQLLQATPEQMRRICRVHPNMLGRDPAQLSQNIESLASKLRLPKEELLAKLRSEPGLLSYNVSTLVNRIITASQMLKLTPELSLTLLSYHRPLISVVSQLPQRLEALRKLLGVPEEELYPIIHKHLNIVRFPIESNEAKLACVASLSQLRPAWAEANLAQPLSNRLRELQAGWSCHWRVVYLVHTGQQATCGLAAAVRMSHAKFRERYPDYPQWLDRYNAAVSAADIPVAVDGPADLIGPTTYQAVISDASLGRNLHAGSLYLRSQVKQDQLGITNGRLQQASWLNITPRRNWTDTDSKQDDNSGFTGDSITQQQQAEDTTRCRSSNRTSSTVTSSAAATVQRVLPVTPAGRLAAWLDVDYSAAEKLLSHKRLAPFRWSEWQTRLEAAAGFLGAVAHCAVAAADGEVGERSHGSGRSVAAVASVAAVPVSQTVITEVTSDSMFYGSTSGIMVEDVRDQAEQLCGRQQQQQQLDQLQQQQQRHQQEGRYQLQQQQSRVEFIPHPQGQEVLQHALHTRHAAAVAAVSVACQLVPFSEQLYSMPPKPPDHVVQYVLQHTDIFVGNFFTDNCRRLARLMMTSAALQQQVQQLPPEQVAKLPGCVSTRLGLLYYLTQTQQPLPWAFEFQVLLCEQKYGGTSTRQRFLRAYPEYEQWEKSHMQEL